MPMKRLAGSAAAALLLAAVLAALVTVLRPGEAPRAQADLVDRGRYLVGIGGCNDCHTPGFMERQGRVPEEHWLVGSSVGFQGPWGTTYPSNLRLTMQALTEDQWVATARVLETRPPMPWFNLRQMHEDDLRAIHRYVRSLPVREADAVPDFVPPGGKPVAPYFVMVPQQPRQDPN
jgi:mono/diheme cytochrome c family protein